MPGDTTAPTVNITAPANDASVSGRVAVQIQATDAVGVTRVELFVNGQSRGTDTAAPWSIEWDTAGLPNGSYRLRVVARDAAGNEGVDDDTTVRIMGGAQDTRAPTVALTAPAANATVRGTVTLSADATDDVGVVRVEFYAGAAKVGEVTAAPYSASWDASAATPGMVTLSARAFDAAGNEGRSMDVSVMVERAMAPDTTPPTVRITAPAGGATVSGLVTVTVDATDDVRVGQVLMFAKDASGAETLLGTDFRAPYEFLWSTEVEMDGARTLTARAFDSSGNLANSDPVEVTITRPAPSPSPTDEPNPDGPKQVRIGKSWACTTTAAPGDVFAQLALAFVAARLVRRRSK
jgi:predicted phage tail protein